MTLLQIVEGEKDNPEASLELELIDHVAEGAWCGLDLQPRDLRNLKAPVGRITPSTHTAAFLDS